MAKYKRGKSAKYAESVSEPEVNSQDKAEDKGWDCEPDIPVHESVFEVSDQPFSAIKSSLLPSTLEDDAHEIFDEFGFRILENTSLDRCPIESSHDRMRWIALIEFAHSEVEGDLKWSDVDITKLDETKTKSLLNECGIAHSLRPFLWPRFCGATTNKASRSFKYEDVVLQSSSDEATATDTQIEEDLLRTLPDNLCFWKKSSKGICALRRVMKAVAYMYPDIGYCQGMNVIIGTLLLFCSEETSFWMMATLIEDIFPANYYSRPLLGVQADERVVKQLIKKHLPELDNLMHENDVEMTPVNINWLLTAFASVFPMRLLIRVWDFLFVYGGVTIFRVMISMLKIKEEELLELGSCENVTAELFNALSQLPAAMTDIDHLIQVCISFEIAISPDVINAARRKQQAILLADHGLLINPNNDTNLPKQKVHVRRLARSKSLVQQIFTTTKDDGQENDPKIKNVKQTEMIVDLRDAVVNICRYFIECNESFENSVSLQADYSAQNQEDDRVQFTNAQRQGHRRARALFDFQRQDEDELGFRKNDIITVICEKDEHCWVGELNGLHGWFPAKFVEVIDERGKGYVAYGDEAVCPAITEKVRGRLASALKSILEHGMRKTAVLNLALHPWLFIEEISRRCVQPHFKAVYSRLTLCTTFSLDENSKILTPEELLFRSVQVINESHNACGAPMDVKLRSLIALAVNEQCLHIWFDLLCSIPAHDSIRERYYHSWSFIRSPAWKLVKCELKLLTQFCFYLDVDLEVSRVNSRKTVKAVTHSRKKSLPFVKQELGKQSSDQPLKEGVRDMLIKHHLFSWDL
ncbi:hypothetical protein AB6A40_000426 [Gnathostoma spinigerum]|uniref:RUN and TBC1 domain-containing protein 3 n=1 Tax=Gnathostoma spinigerum TaxID=75299 RepID=A0ABD6EB69_9BILA